MQLIDMLVRVWVLREQYTVAALTLTCGKDEENQTMKARARCCGFAFRTFTPVSLCSRPTLQGTAFYWPSWLASPLLLPPSLHPLREAEFPQIKCLRTYKRSDKATMSAAENTSQGCFCKHGHSPHPLAWTPRKRTVSHQPQRVFLLLVSYLAASLREKRRERGGQPP